MSDPDLKLLQGTLDVLILKSLAAGPATGTQYPVGFGRPPTARCRSKTVHSTRLCTEWKSAPGLRPNGVFLTASAG
jgi:hypothetical protein